METRAYPTRNATTTASLNTTPHTSTLGTDHTTFGTGNTTYGTGLNEPGVWDSTKQKVGEMVDKGKDMLETGQQKAAEKWEEAKDTASDKWEKAKDSANQTWENVKDSAAESKDKMSGAYEGAKLGAQKGYESGERPYVQKGVMASAKETVDKAGDKLSNLGNTDHQNKDLERAKDSANRTWEHTKDAMHEEKNKLSGAYEGAKKGAEAGYESGETPHVQKGVIESVKEGLQNTGEKLKQLTGISSKEDTPYKGASTGVH